MTRFLKSLFAKTPTIRTRTAARARLELETLDDRLVPAVGVGTTLTVGQPGPQFVDPADLLSTTTPGNRLGGGRLVIVGTDAADDHDVTATATQVKVTTRTWLTIASPDLNSPPMRIWTAQVETFAKSAISRIDYYGKDGNDKYANQTAIPGRAYGQGGDDDLTGGTGDDTLDGGPNNDRLEGRAGNDRLIGNVGYDTFAFAGTALGNDTVEGTGADRDTLDFSALTSGVIIDLGRTNAQTYQVFGSTLTLTHADHIEDAIGSPFRDTIWGNARNNDLYGNDGVDVLFGNDGIDKLYGGAETDYLHGGNDGDLLDGGTGTDELSGDGGADTLYGGEGADELKGGDGSDTLYGGGGNDALYGGSGSDKLYGEAGRDTLVSVDGGADSLWGGGIDTDAFWTDQTSLDTINDLSAAETAHRIAAFTDLAQMRTAETGDIVYSYVEFTPVGKALTAPDLLDPIPASGDMFKANFQNAVLFGRNGPQLDDIDQNRIPNCWLLAALGGVAAESPDAIRQAVTELGDGTYAVRFHRNGEEVYYRVDADLVTTSAANTALRYAGFGQDGSIWAPIIEKAYAFFRRDAGTHDASVNLRGQQDVGWYRSLSYGDSADAGKALGLTASSPNTADFAGKTAYLTELRAQVDAGNVVILGGPGAASDWSATRDERSNAHAWTVVGYTFNLYGQATGLGVRNPYAGPDDWSSELPYQNLSFDAIYASSHGYAVIEV